MLSNGSQQITETTEAATTTSGPTSQPSANGIAKDMVFLTKLLSQLPADADSEVNEKDILELIHQIEAADGIASGMEDRLDLLIGSLNELLSTLEPVAAETKFDGDVERGGQDKETDPA